MMPAWRPRAARLVTRTKESDAHASGEGNNLITPRSESEDFVVYHEIEAGRKGT